MIRYACQFKGVRGEDIYVECGQIPTYGEAANAPDAITIHITGNGMLQMEATDFERIAARHFGEQGYLLISPGQQSVLKELSQQTHRTRNFYEGGTR